PPPPPPPLFPYTTLFRSRHPAWREHTEDSRVRSRPAFHLRHRQRPQHGRMAAPRSFAAPPGPVKRDQRWLSHTESERAFPRYSADRKSTRLNSSHLVISY